jgi:hypothetical protein
VQGLVYGGAGIVLAQKVYTANAVWSPTAGMKSCIIECVGGGGGGGGVSGNNTGYMTTGGGGGSGGYSRTFATATTMGPNQTVTVGAGGAGTFTGTAGTGGDTSVGSLCIARGGLGGVVNGMGGGFGGPSGTGDITAVGSPGQPGGFVTTTNDAFLGGTGGSSYFGGGGTSNSAGSGTGNPGGNYGAGGAGAVGTSAAVASGGNGSPGVVVITEFAGAGAVGPAGANGAPGAPGPQGPAGPSGPGTGDVLHSGTPAAGQIAQWVDAAHIQGVDPATVGFTTGDLKWTHKTAADTGWVLWATGTIGSAGSGAGIRANADTQALFTLYYNSYTDAICPLLTGTGTATTRAAQGTAATAFTANCRMSLPPGPSRALGLAGSGTGLTTRAVGATVGEENHALSVGELASHAHTITDGGHAHVIGIDGTSTVGGAAIPASGDSGAVATNGQTNSNTTGISINAAGGGAAHNNMQPSAFFNVMVKL